MKSRGAEAERLLATELSTLGEVWRDQRCKEASVALAPSLCVNMECIRHVEYDGERLPKSWTQESRIKQCGVVTQAPATSVSHGSLSGSGKVMLVENLAPWGDWGCVLSDFKKSDGSDLADIAARRPCIVLRVFHSSPVNRLDSKHGPVDTKRKRNRENVTDCQFGVPRLINQRLNVRGQGRSLALGWKEVCDEDDSPRESSTASLSRRPPCIHYGSRLQKVVVRHLGWMNCT